MDKKNYDEMNLNLENLIKKNVIQNKKIVLFGHCNATEKLIDLLEENKLEVLSILDNNVEKYSQSYKNIPITSPEMVISDINSEIVVLIVARAFESMKCQLRRLGFKGEVYKLIDYNTYSEYSLSEDTIKRKTERVEQGIKILEYYKKECKDSFFILCPFAALGDIYIMMSYLSYFLNKKKIQNCTVFVVGNGCLNVVKLFGKYEGIALNQVDMDKLIQAVLYTNEKNAFIAHQDRPYVVNLHRALQIKPITLEQIYCTGVFGLPKDTISLKPNNFSEFPKLDSIVKGKTVILSPYAKSVTALPISLWNDIVESYIAKGYKCFTNVFGDEKPLKNTLPISPNVSEIKSVVEKAGIFIGIRSGLCDVIKHANCKKIALYPNYMYSDTKWSAFEIYYLSEFENIQVLEGYKWKMN